MLKMILTAFITLSALAARGESAAAASAAAATTSANSSGVSAPIAASAATSGEAPGAAKSAAPQVAAAPAPAAAASPLANPQNDLQRLQNEYLETKNAGFSKWRDSDVTAVGALLDAIASRFADALAHRQNLNVSGLATRTTIPGWGKPMEVSARSFVELSEIGSANAKIICKLETNLGYFFFPAMVNVECLWLGSSERMQLSGLATSSQPVASADPASLGGIDLNKLELRFPDDPKADRLQ